MLLNNFIAEITITEDIFVDFMLVDPILPFSFLIFAVFLEGIVINIELHQS